MRTTRFVLVILAVAAASRIAGATPTPGQRCAVAKSKAVAKKLTGKLKCWQKALAIGSSTPDAGCITAAETKYGLAVSKIDQKGGCDFPGDGATLEGLVNDAVATIAAFTPAAPAQCCTDGVGACWMDSDPNCQGYTLGGAGTACDGSGACVAAPATPGPCCDDPGGLAITVACVGGPEIGGAGHCDTIYGGTPVANALCPPNGGACVGF
jgi:hypothetical protein